MNRAQAEWKPSKVSNETSEDLVQGNLDRLATLPIHGALSNLEKRYRKISRARKAEQDALREARGVRN
jgi:hypothetical protein